MLVVVAALAVIAAAVWIGRSGWLTGYVATGVAAPGPTPAEQQAAAATAAAEKRAAAESARAAAAQKAKEDAEAALAEKAKEEAAATAAALVAQAQAQVPQPDPAPVTPVVASGCDFGGWTQYCAGLAQTQQAAGLYPFVVVRSLNPFSRAVRVVALCHGGKNVELPSGNFTASPNGRIVVRSFKLSDNETVVANYTVPSYGWGKEAHLAFQTLADGSYSQADLTFVNSEGKCESVSTRELKLAIARIPENGGTPSTGTARVSSPAPARRLAVTSSPTPTSASDTRLAAVEEQVAKNTGDISLLGQRVTSLQGDFHAWASRDDDCGPDCDVRRHMQRNVGRDGFRSY